MKSFLKKGCIFSIPLFIVFVLVYTIDPYYLYHKNREFNQDLYDIDYSLDQGRRFKIISYLNKPKPYIILGASEINLIHERNIPESGWHSLSFGGAPLQETADLFWHIVGSHSIKRIILAPEFIKFYNDCLGEFYLWNTSQSSKAYDLFENKLEYLIDKNVIKSSFYYLLSEFGIISDKNKPKMTKEEFWQHQLSYAKSQYSQEVSDVAFEKAFEKLKKIADYCHQNEIEVKIIIPIQHVDLTMIEFGDISYPIYKKYLYSLMETFGKVYFFDYPNPITEDSEKFTDPFHFSDEKVYINALWHHNDSNCIVFDDKDDFYKLDSIRNMYNNLSNRYE